MKEIHPLSPSDSSPKGGAKRGRNGNSPNGGARYYAIRHKESGRFVSGTDFRYNPPHQILEDEYHPPRLFWGGGVEGEIRHRHINLKRYEVVQVEITVGVST